MPAEGRRFRALPHHSTCQTISYPRNIVACPPASYRWRTCRTRPEFVTGLAVPFSVGNEGCGQLQNILFAVNIREGIIMHRLSEIDSIENPDAVSVLQKGLAAVDYDITFRVSDHVGTVTL